MTWIQLQGVARPHQEAYIDPQVQQTGWKLRSVNCIILEKVPPRGSPLGGHFCAPPTPKQREFPLYHTTSNLSNKIFKKNAQILFPGIVHFDVALQYAKVLKWTSMTGGHRRSVIRTGQLTLFCPPHAHTQCPPAVDVNRYFFIDIIVSIKFYRYNYTDK